MPVALTALALGGHVRLGFEDNIFYRRGVLAKENAELVARVARLAHEWDRACATPDEAREMLRLGERNGGATVAMDGQAVTSKPGVS